MTVIHNFTPVADGFNCNGELMQASDGYLYGMASQGGANGYGTLFRIHPDTTGSFVKLADFDTAVNGDSPLGGLVESTNGRLYGMTYEGGDGDIGTLFEYDPVSGDLTMKLDMTGMTGFYPDSDLLSVLCTPSVSTIDVSSCGTYTAPSGAVFTDSGSYQDIILSASGCDSVITINLTVDNIDLNVINNDPQLLATPLADSYQWLDCADNFTPISGQNASVFNAPEPGVYACLITQGVCQDTTTCTTVFSVGIEGWKDTAPQGFLVYPNPAQADIHIAWTAGDFSVFELIDERGRVLRTWDRSEIGDGSAILYVGDLASGIYLIRGTGEFIGQQRVALVR